MILDGKKVSQYLDEFIQEKLSYFNLEKKYVVFLNFSNNLSSEVYIKMKQKKAKKFGLSTKVVFQPEISFEKSIKILELFNNDENCIGILIQLPLNEKLKPFYGQLMGKIHPKKDIDGLGGVLFGLNLIGAIKFLPATVRAVFEILKFYKIAIEGENITVLGQSNLIGKPLILELMKKQNTLFSFNEFSKKEDIISACKNSKFIISATGDLHFVNHDFVNPDKGQVLIDIGWGKLNNKVAGDFDFEDIFSYYDENKFLYTPVPGGVGPVTVSSIFANLVDLLEMEF